MTTNPCVGSYYLFGAVSLAAIAWLTFPWGFLLLWPSVSLGVISIGYFKFGSWVWFKQNGQHPNGVRTFHWFARYGQEISRRAYSKQCDPWNALLPNLLIGRQLNSAEIDELKSEGVTSVLDLTAEFSEPPEMLRMNYLNLPCLDLTAPSDRMLDEAIRFIDEGIREGKVYVHCKIGYSRTAAVTGSYLLHAEHAEDMNEAIAMLKKARPSIIIRPEARLTIKRYAERCRQS